MRLKNLGLYPIPHNTIFEQLPRNGFISLYPNIFPPFGQKNDNKCIDPNIIKNILDTARIHLSDSDENEDEEKDVIT
jgi:hypothetical protein